MATFTIVLATVLILIATTIFYFALKSHETLGQAAAQIKQDAKAEAGRIKIDAYTCAERIKAEAVAEVAKLKGETAPTTASDTSPKS